MDAKQVNYTEAQVLQIVEAYRAGTDVEQIAALVGKTVRSVVAKLSREGVYQAKTKAAAARVTKEDFIKVIAAGVGVSAEALDSLEKCSKPQLELLAAHFKRV